MQLQSADSSLPVVLQPHKMVVPKLSAGRTAIVPPGSVAGHSLIVVIAIMGFLASLTTGAVYMINQSASAWLHNIASEITIQVEPGDGNDDIEANLGEIAQFLNHQIGIEKARVLSLRETEALVRPWLGSTEGLESLPLPRLIAVQLNRDAPPDLKALGVALTGRFSGARLDDHRRWREQIRSVTSTLAAGGIAVIFLVAAATVAIIVSATRSAMASNRDIIEVLHFVGAQDKFIARQFEMHFQKLGVMAGLVGAGLAGFVFYGLSKAPDLFGNSAATEAEIRRIVGPGTLDWFGYVLLILVVIAIATICRLTSRLGVYRILAEQDR